MPTASRPDEPIVSRATSSDVPLQIPRRLSRWRMLIPVLLLAAYVAQGAWFICTQSFTWDEPLHIAAGFEEWRQGRFKLIADHPPLGHLWPTWIAAHRDSQISFYVRPGNVRADSITPGPEWLARRTRPLNLVLGLLLGVLLWHTARNLFSEGAANVALALYAFSPAAVAHFSMVTTDGITALMFFAVAVQLMRWRQRPSTAQTALLGIALGLLLLSKMHAPPLVALAIVFVLLPRLKDWNAVRQWRWRPALLAMAVALLVLWSGYFFHVTHYSSNRGTLFTTFPPDPTPSPLNFSVEGHVSLWVPAGEYVYGFLQTLKRNEFGHAKYALGTTRTGIAPLMLPLTVALKWPAFVLLLISCSVCLFATGRLTMPPEWPVLVAFPALIFLLAMASRIALGERHLLPAYPFALLFASAAWEFASGRGRKPAERRSRHAMLAIVVVLVAANAADVLRYAPDYLSYFNPLVRPQHSYRLLGDSNLDWGQGLLALKQYESQHPGEQIHLAYFGLVAPEVYGIRAATLPPNEFRSGTIVVSATNLAGGAGDSCGYCWVQQYPMKTMLNHSLFVYQVPPHPNTTPVLPGSGGVPGAK